MEEGGRLVVWGWVRLKLKARAREVVGVRVALLLLLLVVGVVMITTVVPMDRFNRSQGDVRARSQRPLRTHCRN